MFALLLLIAFVGFVYLKLVVPFYYWHRRQIFCVNPLTLFRKVFLGKQSFAESVRAAYEEYPDKRYYGSYQYLQPSLLVRDVDLIKRITVTDFEHFTDHLMFVNEKTDPILGLNLLSLTGQKWRKMRSTLSPAFTGSKMRTMYTLIAETANIFAESFPKTADEVTVVEMRDVFSKYTNDIIANCGFGIKCNSLLDDKNEFYTMGRYVTNPTIWSLMRRLLYGFFPKFFEFFQISILPFDIVHFFLNIIKDAIRVRETEGIVRPDMLHLLIEAKRGRLKHEKTSSDDNAGFAAVQESEIGEKQNQTIEVTDEVITAQVLVFFIAGFATASALMSFLSYELAIDPEIQDKLHKEIDSVLEEYQEKIPYEGILKMKYLDQVISEALRKYPAGYFLNRICVKDYVIEPKTDEETVAVIEKGCLVAIPVIGLHYNSEFFPDPEKFDPERFSDDNKSKIIPGSYLPFGMGPRNCIGSRFALLEMKTMMVSLLSKFRLVPVRKTAIPLRFAKNMGLDAKGGVWLGLQRRK